VASEAAGAPPEAVDADPLATAAPVRAGAGDRDFQDVGTDPALDAGEVAAPADQLTIGRRAMRATPAEQRDRLEQARLAGCIGAVDQVRAGSERGVER
jgi:hypothetical protein